MNDESLEENLPVLGISEFLNPQKIIFGIKAYDRVGLEAERLGGSKIFVVSDENIETVGILKKIIGRLEVKDMDTELFKIPSKEPTIESARKVTNAVRKEKFNLIIGVGGGSCLDSAKLAAMMANNPGDVWEYCAKAEGSIREVQKETLKQILIPTTAGTGSEASNVSVIIDGEYKTWIWDSKLHADVAIVDPLLTLTLPPEPTAFTGMDALSHAIEAYMSAKADPVSDALSLESTRLVFANLRRAYNNGNDLEARRNMSLAATIGGWLIGFPCGGPSTVGHCLSEAIGAKYKIPHGVACAIALPYAIEFNLPLITEKLAIAANVIEKDVDYLTKREAAFKVVEATLELMEDIDLSISLREMGVPREDMKNLAEYIVNERQHLYALNTYNPRRLTIENITELLEKMWEGKI